jgi:hypothetical protein
MSISITSGSSASARSTASRPPVGADDDAIRGQQRLDHLHEETLVVCDQDADPLLEGSGAVAIRSRL